MGMYGLKQAGKLANDLLSQRLFGHGYYQCETTPGLWRHKWRPVMFVLIVDDFGVQYTDRQHAQHLITALQANYEVAEDWTGSKFAGIDLKWDYLKRTCRLTMDGYITELRLRFGHPNQPSHITPHTNIDRSSMVLQPNLKPTMLTPAKHLMQKESNVSKPLLEASSIMPEQSTTSSCARSAPSALHKPQQHRTHWLNAINY
jgi:hypothetical protein